MNFKSFARQLTVATLMWGAFAAASQATVLTTIDMTAIDGTSWAAANSTPVRLDFGVGYGLGTVTFTSINGGFFQNYATPYGGEPQSGLALGGGDSLNVTNESIFIIGHGNSVPGGTLAGFGVTVKLDAGNFAAGTVVGIRSLDAIGAMHQYFSPGDALAAPYSAQLPTDFNSPSVVSTLLVGTDAGDDLYGAGSDGIGSGLAFPLATAANAFSFRLLNTDIYGGGVGFFLARAPLAVPEPGSMVLMLGALAVLGASTASRGKRKGA